MHSEEREAYIGFNAFSGIGPQRFKLLVEYFGSAATAWSADEQTLIEVGLGPKLVDKFSIFRKEFIAKKYEEDLLTQEIHICTRIDPLFPKSLKEISDPPIAIYIRGIFDTTQKFIGVVGTRKPTNYGRNVTEMLTRQLVSAGLTIVSGLARGIDAIAHHTALSSKGKTIAVLGCGLDIIYPPEHKDLYKQILASGNTIISEVPPGHTVIKGLFPARNRIISGLSLGILVTEGAEDSGSLITARYAAEQGREVFAVPGPITSQMSWGPSNLIRNGAKLVTSIDDILEELQIIKVEVPTNHEKSQSRVQLPTDQRMLYDLLLQNPEMNYDELVRESKLSSSVVGQALTQLELNGTIRALGNGSYCIIQ